MDERLQNTLAEPQVLTLEALHPLGTIGPEQSIQRGEATPGDLTKLCEVVTSDAVYSPVSHDGLGQCYDGRPARNNKHEAKAAGGTTSVVVGLALIGERQPGETCSQHTRRIAKALVERGMQVGGHTAEVHGNPDVDCGCGAADKLHESLQYMTEHGEELRNVMALFGTNVDNNMQGRIIHGAAELVSSHYADGGKHIVNSIREVGGEKSVEELHGRHREGVAAINRVHGETLDKAKLDHEMAGKFQAFGIDVWAIRQAAIDAAPTPEKAEELFVAMMYYNLAVAAVLCGKDLRVVIR